MYKTQLNGKNSGTGNVGHSIWHPYHRALLPDWRIFLWIFHFSQKGFPGQHSRERAGRCPRLHPWNMIHLQGTLSGSLRRTLNRFQPGSVSSRHELPEGQKLDSGGSVQSPWSAWSATSPGLMTGSLPTAAPQCDLEHCSFSGFVASKTEF